MDLTDSGSPGAPTPSTGIPTGRGIINFLQTTRPKEQLATALAVLREFKEHESMEEWARLPFVAWTKFEQLEEYVAHLVEDAPLREDTRRQLTRAATPAPPPSQETK